MRFKCRSSALYWGRSLVPFAPFLCNIKRRISNQLLVDKYTEKNVMWAYFGGDREGGIQRSFRPVPDSPFSEFKKTFSCVLTPFFSIQAIKSFVPEMGILSSLAPGLIPTLYVTCRSVQESFYPKYKIPGLEMAVPYLLIPKVHGPQYIKY